MKLKPWYDVVKPREDSLATLRDALGPFYVKDAPAQIGSTAFASSC